MDSRCNPPLPGRAPCACPRPPVLCRPGLLRWLLLYLFICSTPALAASPLLVLETPHQHLNLAPWLEFREDPQAALGWQEALQDSADWRAVQGVHANKGKNQSVWWFRFSVQLNQAAPEPMVLQPGYPLLDDLQLWHIPADGDLRMLRSGDHLPLADRPVMVRNPWLPVQLEPGINQFLLRVDTTSTVSLPLHLVSWSTSASQQERLMLFNGSFYGVVFGLFFYNLFLFLSLRESSYFWYLVYNINMLLFIASFDGTLWLFGGPGGMLQSSIIYMLMFSHCIVATQFSRHFLHTATEFPQLERLLRAKMAIMAVFLVSLPVIGLHAYNTLASLAVLVSSIILLASGIHVWRSGFRYGSFYTLAWGLLLVSLIISTLNSLGLLVNVSAGTLWIKLGVSCELVLLSLGLADRIRALREERQQADEKALQAQLERDAQNRFLARMSHEIRTPLNGVMGMLQLLRDTPLNERQRHYLDTVNGSGKALLSVINDILDYARIESGNLQLEQIAFDPEELLSDSCSLFTAQALDKQLDMHCWVNSNIPSQLIGDPTRIKQILLNLLSNAFKFTDRGGVSLHIEGQPAKQSHGNWSLRFVVRDSGIGIAPEAAQHLFRSFVQADSSTTRRYGGSGLGLAICQELAGIMGGRVTLESQPQHGSTFTLELELPGRSIPCPEPAPLSALVIREQPAEHLQQLLQRNGITIIGYARDLPQSICESARLIILDSTGMPLEQLSQALWSLHDKKLPSLILLDRQHQVRQRLPAHCKLLHLPITPGHLRDALHELLTHQLPLAEPAQRQSMAKRDLRILVAEDNPVNQMVIRGMLHSLGYQCELVGNGAEALAEYRARPTHWQLILMDCEMPMMDGYEATQMIRLFEQEQDLPGIPVLALTAHVIDGYRDRASAAGMQCMLGKPLQRDELAQALELWGRNSSNRQNNSSSDTP